MQFPSLRKDFGAVFASESSCFDSLHHRIFGGASRRMAGARRS
jgi:hypothetical protein